MIAVQPGESTDSLTTQMTMNSISNTEYTDIVYLCFFKNAIYCRNRFDYSIYCKKTRDGRITEISP